MGLTQIGSTQMKVKTLNNTVKLLLAVFVVGCAQVTSLNMNKHEFGRLPTKIVWLQIDGLTEEHLALLKYSYPTADAKTNFEKSLCIGKTWEYDLYRVRPDSVLGFLAQVTGKKNIKNSCEDYKLRPIWDYVLEKGYRAAIFEGETSGEQSFLASRECEGASFLNGVFFWKMDSKIKAPKEVFHVDQSALYTPNVIYYDRSCLTGSCYTTFENNVIRTFEAFERNNNRYVYLARNFEYAKKLGQDDIKGAKSELAQLNKLVGHFQNLASERKDFLFIVTGAGAKDVTFPNSSKDWVEYEKNGKNFSAKKPNLMGSVFVSGARAENFCGIYDQSDILPRIFSGPQEQGLEFTIINPFGS